MAKKDTTSIGFEDKIWKAADVLRGNLNASEYEGVVLGLIFLKYIFLIPQHYSLTLFISA